MANIIELAGPPGAGKSTILNGISKIWNRNTNWVINDKLFPHQKINLLNITSVTKNFPYIIKNGKTLLDYNKLYSAGRRFVMQNTSYIDAYWKNLNNNYSRDLSGYDARFDSVNKFHSKIQKYQFVREHEIDKNVLFDEGLIHDLAGRVPIKDNQLLSSMNDIVAMIELMPLPTGLILIDTDIDIILDRLINRNKVLQMHKGRSKQELEDLICMVKERMHYAKECVIKRGVLVLNVDSKLDVQTNVKNIEQFISSI